MQFHDTGRIGTPSIGLGSNSGNFQGLQFRDTGRSGTPSTGLSLSAGLASRSGERPGSGSLSLFGSTITSALNPILAPRPSYPPAQTNPHSQHSTFPRFTTAPTANVSSQDQRATPTRIPALVTNSSYLSQLGHHKQRPASRLGNRASPPAFNEFGVSRLGEPEPRSRVKPSHQNKTTIGMDTTGMERSPPRTPHSFPAGDSFSATTCDSSLFVALQPESSQGAMATSEVDRSANSSPLPNEGHSIPPNNSQNEQDPEFLDDATLLQAAVSAEKQTELQSLERNTE